MPKRTVLDMTQDILKSMRADEVNTLSDSSEALSIAAVIKNVYYDMLTNRLIPEMQQLDTLTALGDSATPCIMQFPSDVDEVFWVKYDKRQSSSDTQLRFERVSYMEPTKFIEMVNGYDSTDATVVSQVDPGNGLTILCKNDGNPSWYTSFDDNYICFDSYDAAIDTTLTAAKTQVFVRRDPVFTISDTFIPVLDSSLFPLLFNVSKAAATLEIKGEQAPVAAASARSQVIAGQRKRYKTSEENTPDRVDFGRK